MVHNDPTEIFSVFEQVAKEKGVKFPTLSDDMILLISGLDSMAFAIVVTRLTMSLATTLSRCLKRLIIP